MLQGQRYNNPFYLLCFTLIFLFFSNDFPPMIKVTAVITIKIPKIMRGVNCSPNTSTPKNKAVTGSNAPKMAVGVEPI